MRYQSVKDDSRFIHVLLAHPQSEEAEIVLAHRDPPRVPREIITPLDAVPDYLVRSNQ